MEPFRVPDPLSGLSGPYPEIDEFMMAAREGGRVGRHSLAQLWLSEGIPFAFLKCPALYTSVRAWLGAKLDVNAKEIGLLGSARLGYGLSSDRRGKPFDAHSDLDLFIVSREKFDQLSGEFYEWSNDYRKGRIVPSNVRQKKFWMDSFGRIPGNIELGFVDAHLIPNDDRYELSQTTGDLMWRLIEKLKATPGAPTPEKASVRYYADWARFMARVSLNLRWLTK